jgi:UDP-N-acetylglucosamine 2-epimerase (non-hydrolysing)
MTHKIFLIIGTRPDAIKMAPVIREIKMQSVLEPIVVATAQHREMLDQVLKVFDIKVDYDLNIMRSNQSLDNITISALDGIAKLLDKYKPSMTVVQGDTTSSFVGGLASFYRKIPIAHVEAGLRTNDLFHPFPEEANRRLLDAISQLLFPPTKIALQNLQAENVPIEKCFITGNTAIDSLMWIINQKKPISIPELERITSDKSKRIIVITAHRRESFGAPFLEFIAAIRELSKGFPDVLIIYPVHLNPNVDDPVRSGLSGIDNILLPKPLGYADFVTLMNRAYFILTDSGGIQEEAPVLGKPVLVLRDVTERPEAVEAGASQIVGMHRDKILIESRKLLLDDQEYRKIAQKRFIYGDGRASKRIVKKIMKYLGDS